MGENSGNKTLASPSSIALYILVGLSFAVLLLISNTPVEVRVPLTIVFSVIIFLGCLTIAASVLKHFDLANPNEALGLPSGSVRALIALTLILIFAIMVIFLAFQFAPTYDEFPANTTVVYGGKNYTNPNGTITILYETSQAAVDFSKQVLTTVSTLVVALAGFYFGTRSVAQAQQSTEPEVSITLDPKDPKTFTPKGADDTLKITVTAKPDNEVIKAEIKNDRGPEESGTIRPLSPNQFEYKPPPVTAATGAKTVTLRFYLVKYSGDVEELNITIQPPPSQD